MEVAALGLRIDGIGNIDQASTSLGRFTQSADSAEKSASALDPASRKSSQSVQQLGKSSQSTSSSLNALASTAMKVGGVLVAAFSVSKVVQYADAWSDMQSRVGAATGSMDTAGASMQRLLQIANASYSPLEQTAEIYSRNVATFRDLGRSATEAADFTESLNNMLVLTATRGERAASVQNALSKAMAVGKIEADGLETVLANGGEVAQALARELGTTTLGLRQMASDGKITSDVIANAVVKSLEDVRDRAAEMPATMGDAFVRVGNNVTAFVGVVDQATGASGALANAIISLADSALAFGTNAKVMEGAAVAAGALAIVIAARLTPSVVASGTAFATSSIESIRYQAALARMAGVSAPAAAGIAAVGAAARVASGALALVGGPLGAIMLAASALVYFSTRASEAEKESEALDARINKLAGSFDSLTVAQARSAIQDYSSKLAEATFTMETAEAKAFTLRRNLEQFPNSAKAEQWARDLVTAEGAVDDAKGAVDEINDSLRRLNELVENGGASKLGDDAEKASDAFSKLNKQLSERLAIAGKASEADRLAARIQGGFIEGLKDGEGEVLIALQKQIDAREALARASKKESSNSGATESEKLVQNLQQQVFQLEKRTAVEKLAFDIKKGDIKLSSEQLELANSLAAQIDAAATAERNKSAEIDRQNTMYQLQESLIARQQQYDAELATSGMGERAASQMKERIALEQAAQRELRDLQHQHGQEMRAAETEEQRNHLQLMYAERLRITQEAQAAELEAYDAFTQQKNALDQDWMAGAQSAFATYSEQATNLYSQTAEMVTSTLDSVTNGIADAAAMAILYGEDFSDSMAAVGRSIVENVLSALIKMGVQYAINAAIGQSFGAAATAAGVAQASALSAAWATPAALVSLASFGANGPAAIASITSTTALTQGLAMAGFQQGGYTGNMGVSDVAGVVHGREYVFDAAATSRIGVPTLEAIRSGRPLNSSGGISNGSGSDMGQPITIAPQVVVNGDPDKATIARIEKATADGARLAYQQISNDLATGRGSVSKSLQAGYGVSRRKG